MKETMLIAILCISMETLAQDASWINTHPRTGNAGLDVKAIEIDLNNAGIAIYPTNSALPLNPSGEVPFALTVNGDAYLGDIYCLADAESISAGPQQYGCIYGRSVTGNRAGPVIYQSNKYINTTADNDEQGGSGVVMWPDKANADGYGNRGYLDVWAWGKPDSAFSNTINFGNRDSSGNPHRRLQITENGGIRFIDLVGAGNSLLCIHADGTVYRGNASGC